MIPQMIGMIPATTTAMAAIHFRRIRQPQKMMASKMAGKTDRTKDANAGPEMANRPADEMATIMDMPNARLKNNKELLIEVITMVLKSAPTKVITKAILTADVMAKKKVAAKV